MMFICIMCISDVYISADTCIFCMCILYHASDLETCLVLNSPQASSRIKRCHCRQTYRNMCVCIYVYTDMCRYLYACPHRCVYASASIPTASSPPVPKLRALGFWHTPRMYTQRFLQHAKREPTCRVGGPSCRKDVGDARVRWTCGSAARDAKSKAAAIMRAGMQG